MSEAHPTEAPTELTIVVDKRQMTIGDLRFLERAKQGKVSDGESLDFFERVIEGGATSLPLDALEDVWAAIFTAVYGKAVTKNSATPS